LTIWTALGNEFPIPNLNSAALIINPVRSAAARIIAHTLRALTATRSQRFSESGVNASTDEPEDDMDRREFLKGTSHADEARVRGRDRCVVVGA
jgi:hypothetical protein